MTKKVNDAFVHFGAPRGFTFVVPKQYKHDSQIDDFFQKYYLNADTDAKEGVYDFDLDLTSENFERASTKLVPGKAYWVEIYPISDLLTTRECLAFLDAKRALLVGAQGLTLLFDQNPECFDAGKSIVSFDRKDTLFKDEHGQLRVPCIQREKNGTDVAVELSYYNATWTPSHEILCVRELPS